MYCQNCGSLLEAGVNFCPNCGTNTNVVANNWGSRDDFFDFRRHFAASFILAALTAFFWITQFLFPNASYGWNLLAPLSSLLSLVARGAIITSFVRKSKDWLAISAISSTSSLAFTMIGSFPYGYYTFLHWPNFFTLIFSLATLITYFVQAKSAGLRPYVIDRNAKLW
jgi:hypothetical protein